jgi:GNAT superfamily N-acetyltransferase
MEKHSFAAIGSIAAQRTSQTATVTDSPAATLAIRQVGAQDASNVIDVVAEAFLKDPTWSWAFPDPAARKRWWTHCVTNAVRYPCTLATVGFETIAIWIPPDGTEFSHEGEQKIPQLLKDLVGPRAVEVAELLNRFEQAHPRTEPHYHLSLFGTRDRHRGRGLGMALLNENLARIDAERMPAYLESSNPANNHRYEAVGFATVVAFEAPGNGPVISGMWRKANGQPL